MPVEKVSKQETEKEPVKDSVEVARNAVKTAWEAIKVAKEKELEASRALLNNKSEENRLALRDAGTVHNNAYIDLEAAKEKLEFAEEKQKAEKEAGKPDNK